MLRRCVQLVVAGAVLIAGITAAWALDPRETRARAHFAAGRYQEALDGFADLFAEKSDPLYLRNIGRCHQMMKHADQAIDSFRLYLTRAKKLSAVEREEINGYIREMEALKSSSASPSASTQPDAPRDSKIPTVLASGPPPGTEPLPARPVPPPAAAAAPPVLVSSPAAPVEDERSPVYTRWWFWTGLGVLVAGAVGTALFVSSRGEQSDCLGQPVCFAAGGN